MSTNYVLTLCCLCAGLIFDPLGILRMVLLASCIHELGHILAYCVCTHSLPPIIVSVGGFTLGCTHKLSLQQELIVLACGPLGNIAAALIFALLAQYRAAYGIYFFMSTNICIGAYNMLPFGVLDGARILQGLIPESKVHMLYAAQKTLLAIFTLLCLTALLCADISNTTRLTMILAPLYLWICEGKR